MKRIKVFMKRFAALTYSIRIVLLLLVLFAGTGILLLLFYPVNSINVLTAPLTALSEHPEDDFEKGFAKLLARGEGDILSREVTIDLSASEIKAKFALVVPVDGRIADEITKQHVEQNIVSFVRLVFGGISVPSVNGDIPIFKDKDSFAPSWTINSSNQTLNLVISTQAALPSDEPFLIVDPASPASSAEHDQLTINFTGFRISYINPVSLDVDLSSDKLVIEKQNSPMERLHLTFRSTSVQEDPAPIDSQASKSRQLSLQDLDDWLAAHPISTAFYSILEAAPLLLFLWIVRSYTNQSEAETLQVLSRAFVAFLLFHFVLYSLGSITDWFYESTLISSASKFVTERIGIYYRVLPDQVFELSAYYFGIPILGIVLPTILYNWWGTSRTSVKTKYPLGILVLELLTPLLGFVAIVWLTSKYLTTQDPGFFFMAELFRVAGMPVVLGIYLLFIVLMLVLTYGENRSLIRQSWSGWLAQLVRFLMRSIILLPLIIVPLSFLLICLLAPQIDRIATFDSTVDNLVLVTPAWIWIVVLMSIVSGLFYLAMCSLQRKYIPRQTNRRLVLYSLGLIFLFGFLRVYPLDLSAYHLLDGLEWMMLLTIFGAALISAFAVVITGAIERIAGRTLPLRPDSKWWWLISCGLALPLGALTAAGIRYLSLTDLYDLAYRLDNLIVLLWFSGVLWVLYEQGKTNTRITHVTYEIGVLASAAVLFSVTANWFFIPFNFLAGWLLLRYLIRLNLNWDELNKVYQYVLKNRNALLEKIIDLNAIDSSFAEFRKKITGRFSNDKVTFNTFDRIIVEKRAKLDKQTKKSFVFEMNPKDLVFAFGPYSSSWKNAVHGAKWAIVLATPWLILYMRDFLSAPARSEVYPLWTYMVNVLYILFRWAGMGFIFGYFFPYIRGTHGVAKGFRMFLVTFLAALPLAILYRESNSDWQAFLFWGLQIFIEYMLLGLLAFDYVTLREHGRGWQTLFDVHGLAQLGISVSTILAAIGAAIIALLTSQATNLIGISLKFIFPDMPADFLPK